MGACEFVEYDLMAGMLCKETNPIAEVDVQVHDNTDSHCLEAIDSSIRDPLARTA
jgi:hypothetical protein